MDCPTLRVVSILWEASSFWYPLTTSSNQIGLTVAIAKHSVSKSVEVVGLRNKYLLPDFLDPFCTQFCTVTPKSWSMPYAAMVRWLSGHPSGIRFRWSVWIKNSACCKYGLQGSTANRMAPRHSFSYVESAWFLGSKALLMYAVGCPFCCSTTPIPFSLASVSTNGWEKSGRASTGAVIKVVFRALKAYWWSSVQQKGNPFLSRVVSGLAKIPKPLTNFL